MPGGPAGVLPTKAGLACPARPGPAHAGPADLAAHHRAPGDPGFEGFWFQGLSLLNKTENPRTLKKPNPVTLKPHILNRPTQDLPAPTAPPTIVLLGDNGFWLLGFRVLENQTNPLKPQTLKRPTQDLPAPSSPPTIVLLGDPEVVVPVLGSWADPGACAQQPPQPRRTRILGFFRFFKTLPKKPKTLTLKP